MNNQQHILANVLVIIIAALSLGFIVGYHADTGVAGIQAQTYALYELATARAIAYPPTATALPAPLVTRTAQARATGMAEYWATATAIAEYWAAHATATAKTR